MVKETPEQVQIWAKCWIITYALNRLDDKVRMWKVVSNWKYRVGQEIWNRDKGLPIGKISNNHTEEDYTLRKRM